MNNKITFLTLVLTILLVLIPQAKSEAPYEFTLDLQTYKSTKVTFNYPYTNNHSIVDISTIGLSVYKHEGSATHLTFIAEDIDIYAFTVRLRYENVTLSNQTKVVLIGLWSGTEAMDSYSIRTMESEFDIKVRLSLTEQPTYPTPEEVSGAVVHKIEQDLVKQTEEMKSLVARVEAQGYLTLVTIALTIAISLCVAMYSLVMWRRKETPNV